MHKWNPAGYHPTSLNIRGLTLPLKKLSISPFLSLACFRSSSVIPSLGSFNLFRILARASRSSMFRSCQSISILSDDNSWSRCRAVTYACWVEVESSCNTSDRMHSCMMASGRSTSVRKRLRRGTESASYRSDPIGRGCSEGLVWSSHQPLSLSTRAYLFVIVSCPSFRPKSPSLYFRNDDHADLLFPDISVSDVILELITRLRATEE